MNRIAADGTIRIVKPKRAIETVNKGLRKRYRAERRFRLLGLSAVVTSLLFLSILFINIFGNGYTAFFQTYIKLNVYFDPETLRADTLARADYPGLVKQTLRTMFPDVQGRRDKRKLYKLVSSGASFQIRDMVLRNPDIIGKEIPVWYPPMTTLTC